MDRKSGKFRGAIFYLLVLIGGATGVRNLEMMAPAMVRSGDTALLSCRYDLDGALLYTIKWYLNDHEFYRYVPGKSPPQLTYPVQGIIIDVQKSNVNEVTLRNMSRELTGLYTCEVSEDQPTYHTARREQRIEVVDVPGTDPVIVVERQRLPAGETLRANCTSGAAHPAPNVTWTLNEDPLNDSMMHYRTWTRKIAQDKMEFTWSGLELKVSSEMFHGARLRLQCIANISGVYTATAEFDVKEDRPLIASITGDASPHSHRSSGVGHGKITSISSTAGLARMAIVIGGLIVPSAGFR